MQKFRAIPVAKPFIAVLSAVLVSLCLNLIFQIGSEPLAHAQETKSDFQELIEKVNSDHILKGDQVTFRLAAPLDDGGLRELTVPGSQREGTVDFFVLTEIGADHVCISQKFGGMSSLTCIPYINIAAISYVEPPSVTTGS